MKRPRSALLAAVALLAARPGAPQEEPAPVRETAEVSLVQVAARVLDRNGNPVRGLTEKDFTLFDEGKRRELVAVDAIDLAEKEPVWGSTPPAAARRRFLILFDFSFARPRAIVAARRAASDFVLQGLGDQDLAAVATYSVERGLRLLVTFSADRAQLAQAIETLGLETPREVAADPLGFAYDTQVVNSAAYTRGGGRAEATGAELVEHLETLHVQSQARADEYTRSRVRHLIRSFGDLARALNSVAGRKDVIYLSEGFRSRHLVGTRESDQDQQWLVTGEIWKVDSDRRFGNTPLRTELGEMGELFRRSDCVIHAVDIAGIREGSDPQDELASVGTRETENSLYEIASATGGETFRNTNDLGSQLSRLMSRTSLVYLLSFRADARVQEGKYHELKVKVSVPGARVTARPGYYERAAARPQSPFERNLTAADVIANEIPMREIPARVLVMPFASQDGNATVPVLIEVPGEPFLAGAKGDRSTAEIYVYASDEQNQLRDFLSQTITLDLPRSGEKVRRGGFRYHGELALAPGTYRVRTLVRNSETGRMGLTVLSLPVPSFSAGQPYLLPPVFLDGPENWLLLKGRDRNGQSGGGSRSPLLEAAGRGFAPAALPSVRPGSPSRVCIVAYHLGSSDGAESLRLGSQILASDGRPLQEASLAVLGRSAAEADGKRVLLLDVTAPEGLAPGRYGLRIFLQDSSTGQARQSSAPFIVP